MKNYRSSTEKFVFSPRMEAVHSDVLPRLKTWKERENTFTGETPVGGKNPFLDAFRDHAGEPYVIKLAHAIVRSWLETDVVIHKGEAVVGITRPLYPFYEHFSWGIRSKLKSYDFSDFDPEVLRIVEQMEPVKAVRPDLQDMHMFQGSSNLKRYLEPLGTKLFGAEAYEAIYQDKLFTAGYFQGHTIPSYPTLLENGLDGMLEKIDRCAAANPDTEENRNFYEANRIIVRGMSAWLEAYADEAARLAAVEAGAAQKQYYLEIEANCRFVAHKKPETLYQAVQLIWCLALWDWVDCLGRVDQFLYPFFEKSVREGDVVSAEDAITSLMFKIWEHGAHNVTVSGCKADGSDATNDLSFLLLQVLRAIHDTHPRICVRIQECVSDELMELILTMWAEGMSDPSIVSDTLVIPALQKIEVSLEDARNYATAGCQEIEIPGKSNTGSEDGSFSLAKLLEITLRGGKSVACPDVQVGPKTKDFFACETFEELFDAYTTQIQYFTGRFCDLCDKGQELRVINHSKLVKGIFTDGVLESAKPHDAGGPTYNYGLVETIGLAAVADSLTAIRKFVFEEKTLSKEKLWAALEANFEGYEDVRQMLLNGAPKFGNDNDEADEMASRVLNLFWDEIGKYRSVRGGLFTGGCSLLEAGISFGKTMCAMPDGTFAGEPLGNSMGPRPGFDKNGLTAMLRSVQKLPLEKGVGGSTLNVILTTKMLSTPELRKTIAAVLKSYMKNGGELAQITTANKEDLLDAQVHPERHGNLIVRVGGFSSQFVQLNRATQDEIISRYA